MRAPQYIVALGCCYLMLITALAGCRCKPGTRTAPDAGRSKAPARRAQPVKVTLSPSDHRLMTQINIFAKEAFRRAKRDRTVMKDVATMIERTAAGISLKHTPASFQTHMQQLRQRAKALGQSKQPRQAYSAMIDTCIQCHQAHAKSTLARVKRLRLK